MFTDDRDAPVIIFPETSETVYERMPVAPVLVEALLTKHIVPGPSTLPVVNEFTTLYKFGAVGNPPTTVIIIASPSGARLTVAL